MVPWGVIFQRFSLNFSSVLILQRGFGVDPPGGDQGISLRAAYEWSPPGGPVVVLVNRAQLPLVN